MLLYLKSGHSPTDRAAVETAARDAGFVVDILGTDLLGIFGAGDTGPLSQFEAVDRIVDEPEGPVLVLEGDGIVQVGPVAVGEGFTVIAGPCAVEGRERLLDLAHAAKEAGADMLRGGAYKPRTSPYSFRGLGKEGLRLLREAGDATGLPVASEILDTRDTAVVAEHVDLIQVGARNMMNHALLLEVGRAGRPVLLKRGMGARVRELLYAAEYLLLQGAPGVILCERGVTGMHRRVRNTLDLAAVPLLKGECRLPVIVDPSHATGMRELVPAMARAAAGAGAAGVMVEIHDEPECALSDGRQAIPPDALSGLIRSLREIASVAARAENEEKNL